MFSQNNVTILYSASALTLAIVNTGNGIVALVVANLPIIVIVNVNLGQGLVVNIAAQLAVTLTGLTNLAALQSLSSTLANQVAAVNVIVSAALAVAPGIGNNTSTGTSIQVQDVITALVISLNGLPGPILRGVVLLVSRLLATTTGIVNGQLVYVKIVSLAALLGGATNGTITSIELGQDLAWVVSSGNSLLFSISATGLVFVNGVIIGDIRVLTTLPGSIVNALLAVNLGVSLNLGAVLGSVLAVVANVVISLGPVLVAVGNTVNGLLVNVGSLVNGILTGLSGTISNLLGGVGGVVGGLVTGLLGAIGLTTNVSVGLLGGGGGGLLGTGILGGGILGGGGGTGFLGLNLNIG